MKVYTSFLNQAIAIRLATVAAQATTAIPLSLIITTFTKSIATSDVIFLPFFTRTRLRFPAKAKRTNTVIHVTIVVRTAKIIIINAAIRKAAAIGKIGLV